MSDNQLRNKRSFAAYQEMLNLENALNIIKEEKEVINKIYFELLKKSTLNFKFNSAHIILSKIMEIQKTIERYKKIIIYIMKNDYTKNNADFIKFSHKLLKNITITFKNYKEDANKINTLLDKHLKNKYLHEQISKILNTDIIETQKEFANEALGLNFTRQDVEKYFANKDFIVYLNDRLKIVPDDKHNRFCYGINPYYDIDNYQDIEICVPEINNLNTFLTNVFIYDEVFHKYKQLYMLKDLQDRDEEANKDNVYKVMVKEEIPKLCKEKIGIK